MSGEATFFHDIVGGGENCARGDNFSESSEEPFDDDDEGFSTTSLPKVGDESHSDESGSRPTDDRHSIPPQAPPAFNVPSEIAVQNPPPPPDDTDAAISSHNQPCINPDEPPPIPKGKSLRHHYMRWPTK